jgi:hypothetical protein
MITVTLKAIQMESCFLLHGLGGPLKKVKVLLFRVGGWFTLARLTIILFLYSFPHSLLQCCFVIKCERFISLYDLLGNQEMTVNYTHVVYLERNLSYV